MHPGLLYLTNVEVYFLNTLSNLEKISIFLIASQFSEDENEEDR